ncbi:MAG: T9SS type A sorting domain-containing protein [Sphingobacteriales bacterium]|nr:MAG: T9SS type A sorting domain-containing protein [Sphingobacteriales bacterium]
MKGLTGKETWRLNMEGSYATNNIRNAGFFKLEKRMNAEISYHYSFPFMGNTYLMAAAGYYGEDPYNIYYRNHYGYMRLGISASLAESDLAVTKIDELLTLFSQSPNVQLVTNDFSGEDQAVTNTTKVKDRLTSIGLSPNPRTFENVYKRQRSLAQKHNASANNQFFWFSDFQKSTAGNMKQLKIDSLDKLFLVPVQGKASQNVFVDSVWLASPFIREMQNNVLYVKVFNSGGNEVEKLPVKLFIDNAQASTASVDIAPNSSAIATFNFTVGTPLTPAVNATLNFTPALPSRCNNFSGNAFVTYAFGSGTDFQSLVANMPYIRIAQAPSSWLAKVCRVKDGSTPVAPVSMRLISDPAYNTIDTSGNIYATALFNQLGSQYLEFPFTPGTYTFELKGSCLQNTIASVTFTISPNDAPIAPINLGASAAYICDNGTDIKLVAVPAGGKPSFQYQIKPSGQPDAAYTVLQTSNTFNLPAGTPAGSTYTLRVTDACGSSYIGEVPVNSITGDLFLFPNNNCIGSTARIITGYIPGATYTWTLPNGSTIVNDTNEIHIPNFSAANIGTYSVSVSALGGCITKAASRFIADDCITEGPLPVKLTQFTARKNAINNVDVRWQTSMEMNSKNFEVQRSADGVNYTTIAVVDSRAPGGSSAVTLNYSIEDATAAALNVSTIYYRLKQVDLDGRNALSKVETVRFNGAAAVEVYPNPLTAGEALNIKGHKVGQTIRLLNATGQVLVSLRATNAIEKITLPNLKSGVYHLQVMGTDGSITTQKLVKQ